MNTTDTVKQLIKQLPLEDLDDVWRALARRVADADRMAAMADTSWYRVHSSSEQTSPSIAEVSAGGPGHSHNLFR